MRHSVYSCLMFDHVRVINFRIIIIIWWKAVPTHAITVVLALVASVNSVNGRITKQYASINVRKITSKM